MCTAQSILQRVGIRQLPGICWYPAKRTVSAVNQGGTANFDSSLTDNRAVKGVFFLITITISQDGKQYSIREGKK